MSIRNYRKYLLASLFGSFLLGMTPQLASGQVPTEKTLLWEISGKDLTKSSYLFGTIHSICIDKLRIGKQQRKALDNVQQVYLELDLDDISTIIGAAADSKRSGTQSLQELMTPQEYRKVKNFFENVLYTPMWQVSQLTISDLTSKVIGDDYADCATSSWEAMLLKAAKNRQMEVFGLEEIKEQADDLLNTTPIRKQITDLIEAIDNRAKLKKEAKKGYRELQAIYASQDVDKIYKFSTKVSTNDLIQAKIDRQSNEVVLNRRNRNWIPRIGRIAKEKPTFFGVGAAHLGGQQGVISLLRQAGYTVKPLFDSALK
jgi:uncharacterized protein